MAKDLYNLNNLLNKNNGANKKKKIELYQTF